VALVFVLYPSGYESLLETDMEQGLLGAQ
jgi:hypothetical protein